MRSRNRFDFLSDGDSLVIRKTLDDIYRSRVSNLSLAAANLLAFLQIHALRRNAFQGKMIANLTA